MYDGWCDHDIPVRGVRSDNWGVREALSILHCLLQTMLLSEKPSVSALSLAIRQSELCESLYMLSARHIALPQIM